METYTAGLNVPELLFVKRIVTELLELFFLRHEGFMSVLKQGGILRLVTFTEWTSRDQKHRGISSFALLALDPEEAKNHHIVPSGPYEDPYHPEYDHEEAMGHARKRIAEGSVQALPDIKHRALSTRFLEVPGAKFGEVYGLIKQELSAHFLSTSQGKIVMSGGYEPGDSFILDFKIR